MSTVLDALTSSCSAPSAERATTLPPIAYGSDELFALESDKVFKAGWVPLCRAEQVATPGSYYSIDLLGTPLVVTRDRDGVLRVLSRTCRHRWMEVATGSGTAPALQCPYHLWTYGMDGRLAGAPEMQGVEDFCKEDVALTAYHHEVWQGFVFVNLDGTAAPLAPQLAGLEAYIGGYDLANYQTVMPTDWGICEWDWKIMVDNFMECYHHMGPHRATIEDEFPGRLSTIDPGGDLYSMMWANQADGYRQDTTFLSPGAATLGPESYRRVAIFIVYPLLQVSMSPSFMYWLKTLPLGPGRIALQLDIAASPATLAMPDAERRKEELVESILAIHREDLDVCAAVQRAIRSGATGVGRLSLLEKALWEFYAYLGRQLGLSGSPVPLAETSAA